jgi:peptidoglycan hydrolase-like protein with peptidoglycan-binding domain
LVKASKVTAGLNGPVSLKDETLKIVNDRERNMQQTFIPTPTHYTRDEFRKLISSIQLGAWRPKFPTLHNTGVPSLAQWKAYGPTTKEGWGGSLNRFFASASKGKPPWHAGPHFVCCPDYIWYLSDLRFDGVSVSCWNPVTVGIEMVGNYELGSDDFATGDGAKVGDNAAFALAVLCEKYGWKLENYAQGVSGLHFHKECTADHHACPGSKVSKAKMTALANAQLALLNANPLAPTAAPVAAAPVAPPATEDAPDIMSVEDIQSALNQLGANPQLNVTGDYDQATKAAVSAFQQSHNCDVDGWVGSQTISAIQASLAQKAAPDIMSVEDIQSALNQLGANPQLVVTGDYDQATKAAVSAFQQSHNCDVDGWVGQQTTDAIKAALKSA